jgi:hypothetical protein
MHLLDVAIDDTRELLLQQQHISNTLATHWQHLLDVEINDTRELLLPDFEPVNRKKMATPARKKKMATPARR